MDLSKLSKALGHWDTLASIDDPMERVECAKTIHQCVVGYIENGNKEDLRPLAWKTLASNLNAKLTTARIILSGDDVNDTWTWLVQTEEKMIKDALKLWEDEVGELSIEKKKAKIDAVFGGESDSDSDKTAKESGKTRLLFFALPWYIAYREKRVCIKCIRAE